jgi:hypothetical protein
MVMKVLRKWPRRFALATIIAGASLTLNVSAASAGVADTSPTPANAFVDAGLTSIASPAGGRPGSVSDWNGDGLADVLAVDSDGNLFVYLNDGLRLADGIQIDSGWETFRLVQAADFTGDGFADVIGIDNSGALLYYAHNGNQLDSPMLMPRASGGTWANVQHLMVADWSCDGHADILVVENDILWYYPNNNNSISNGEQISSGWSSAAHVEAADWSGDGCADILSQNFRGEAYTTSYFPHNGSGLSAPNIISFGGLEMFLRAMDFTGDGRADLVSAKRDGIMYNTPNNGSGGLGAKTEIGSGFGTFAQVL